MPYRPKRIPPLGPPRASARQRILASWRGVDLAPIEKGRQSSAHKAGAIIPLVLADLRIDSRRAEAEIVKVWNSLLQSDVVAHAQPVGIHKGTLFVAVDSSPWLSEIVRYRRKGILERLRHSFGNDLIKKISFRIG